MRRRVIIALREQVDTTVIPEMYVGGTITCIAIQFQIDSIKILLFC